MPLRRVIMGFCGTYRWRDRRHAAAEVNRIFEPFYTKKVMNRRNSGLGLSVVWGTVKDLEEASISSAAKTRDGFDLYFPAVSRRPMHIQRRRCQRVSWQGRKDTGGRQHEEGAARSNEPAILSRLGYAPRHMAGRAEEAIRLLRKETVDLVVLDMIMDNGPDGLQTYREIHDPSRPESDAFKRLRRRRAGGEGNDARCRRTLLRKPHTAESLGTAVEGA